MPDRSRSTESNERPWFVRVLLAIAAAGIAVSLNRLLPFLHSFPLILPFPVALIACWYLGMWPGILCAVIEGLLSLSLVRQTQSSLPGPTELRIVTSFLVAIAFGWLLRVLDRQRSQLTLQKLQQQLSLAYAQRELAEERAHASEALRDRDELLQISLKANGMGLWVWDLGAGTIQWSDEVYRIAGMEPGTVNPSFTGWLDHIHPDDLARVQAAVDRTRSTGAEYHQQYRMRLDDGSDRWVESQGRCQRDSDGRPLRIVGVIADITTRKRSEEAMLRAEKLAVAGRLAASVAHEINNPLEAVANLLYLISHAKSADSASELAQQAMDELMRVSLITQQTLKFHRQAGTPKPTLLSEIVQTVLTLFRSRLLASHIEIELHAQGEFEISCMSGEVHQIFANLVSNAVDAMPQGGRLIVRVGPSRDWRTPSIAGMRVTFFDTGCGMDMATRRRLFEPFFTTKADTGTGLGMWVVGQLAERHGGNVRVWSSRRSPGGTAVSVFLPSKDSPLAPAPAMRHGELLHH